MNARKLVRSARRTAAFALTASLAGSAISCANKPDYRPASATNYPDLGVKQMPAYLDNCIYQYTELRGTEPYRVEGFGLVVNADPLPNNMVQPGSQLYPSAVREYMIKEMVKRGVGSPNSPGWENISPEQMLNDSRNSIVKVQGFIPPGARGGRSMDIQVQALPGSTIHSLAHGWLYQSELSPLGGDPRAPGDLVHLMGRAEGQVFVNPALALNVEAGTAGQRASLRDGVILDGGYIIKDRPLILQLRTPQRSLARKIEMRINQAFQDSKTASAKDEGLIEVFVPQRFGGDWQHFSGVMRYLFMVDNPAFPVVKAKQLAEVALRDPNAPLEDISYAWEGLGSDIIPIVTPLMSNPNPDIAFAAARAAACVGDVPAQDVLVAMADTPGFKFQINAVHTLGTLPESPAIDQKVRKLLDAPDTLVRLEAYRMLVQNKDQSIYTRVVAKGNEKFVLDLVPSNGPTIIYASRSGIPRIAVIGPKPSLAMPVFFSALDNRLTLSSPPKDPYVTIYYQGREFPQPITVLSNPDLAEVIARLGGDGPTADAQLDFGYGEVVGLLQSLTDSHKLSAKQDGKEVAVTFILQERLQTPDDIRSAPLLPGEKPQANADQP